MNKTGFTLIEFLFVVAVLTIVSSAAFTFWVKSHTIEQGQQSNQQQHQKTK